MRKNLIDLYNEFTVFEKAEEDVGFKGFYYEQGVKAVFIQWNSPSDIIKCSFMH